MEKSLKNKAINIKGKSYVMVSDRIIYFNAEYPKDGCIKTELISPVESTHIVIKATVYPEGLNGRFFTGYSQAVVGEGMVNKTAALENAETSAVGRALAMMGIGVIDGVASVDEINKATVKPAVKATGKVCSICGKEALISAKSGNPYCLDWAKHKKEGMRGNIISAEEFNKPAGENMFITKDLPFE